MTAPSHIGDTTVRELVEVACRAPSVHNTQPWRWVVDGPILYLVADETRHLTHADEFGRQLVISCGSALDHLRLAAAQCHLLIRVHLMPVESVDNVLAAVEFVVDGAPDATLSDLYAAIGERHTDRRPYGEADLGRLPLLLNDIASDTYTSVVALSDDAREELLEASDMSASARRYDSVYKNELKWWTGHSAPKDGVPADILPSIDKFSHLLSRDFPAGGLDMGVTTDRGEWIAIMTAGDERQDWLHTGMALSQVLLAAAAAGYSTCPISHVTELPAARKMVQRLAEKAGSPADWFPQILVRAGSVPVRKLPTVTPRRPVEEVIYFTDAHHENPPL